MTSKQLVQDIQKSDFIDMTTSQQRNFLAKIGINELKAPEDLPLLKKYIALKVLMEARNAAEDKSVINFTAQFRNLLAFIGFTELRLRADKGQSGDWIRSPEYQDDAAANGYRLFHISDMGLLIWNRKFFNLGMDEANNIVTRKVNTLNNFFTVNNAYSQNTAHSKLKTWDELNDPDQLRCLFAEIKKEASYENTLAYDLLSAAMFCANILIDLSLHTGNLSILLVPLALAMNVAIYAVVIPPALMLFAMEHLLVNPIKWVVNSLQESEHEAFINEVTSAAPSK